MNIAFAQENIRPGLNFHFATLLRVKKHSIANLNTAHQRSSRDHTRPGQALADLSRCRDQDPTSAFTLPFAGLGRDQHPVVEHSDRQFLSGFGSHGSARYPKTASGSGGMADTQVLGTCVFGRAGSSPASRTQFRFG
jgi:hypothetical protein